MNILSKKYSGFCFELNFELNHFSTQFNEKMNFQNVSPAPSWGRRKHCLTMRMEIMTRQKYSSLLMTISYKYESITPDFRRKHCLAITMKIMTRQKQTLRYY